MNAWETWSAFGASASVIVIVSVIAAAFPCALETDCGFATVVSVTGFATDVSAIDCVIFVSVNDFDFLNAFGVYVNAACPCVLGIDFGFLTFVSET